MNKNIQKTIQIISLAGIAIIMITLVFIVYTNVSAQTPPPEASLVGDPVVSFENEGVYRLRFTLSFSNLENGPYAARANLSGSCRRHKDYQTSATIPVNLSHPTSYFMKKAPSDLSRTFTCNAEVQIKTSASSAWTTLNTVAIQYSYAPQDIDETAPTLSNPSSIGIINSDETAFTFTSSEAGDITYGGSCGSDTTEIEAETKTITLKKRVIIGSAKVELLRKFTDGTYDDCTLTVTDAADNTSEELEIPSFTVDTTDPELSDPSDIGLTSDNTPSFTFTASEVGTITYGGDCYSDTTETVAGENTITFNTLADGTYNSCALEVEDEAENTSGELAVPEFTIDTTAPVLSDPDEIGLTKDDTPSFTFTASEAGDIAYEGSCSSKTKEAKDGKNTITFRKLGEGTYNDCTITITDAMPHTSNELTVPSFTIDTTAPTLSSPSNIGITDDTTPEFTFTSSEAGTLQYKISGKYTTVMFRGRCSAKAIQATAGENTITFNAFEDGTYDDCALHVVDAAKNKSGLFRVPKFTIDILTPELSNPSDIGNTNDNTPDFTFTASEAGDITYGGSCRSGTTEADEGRNTITFKRLGDETYDDCTITVTDALARTSEVLQVPVFTIDTTAPSLTSLITTSSNKRNINYVRKDDTVTITFTVSETLAETPEVTMAGQGVRVTESGNAYIAIYTVTDTTAEEIIACDITATDLYGNTLNMTNITTGIVVDNTAPVITLNGKGAVYTSVGKTYRDEGATADTRERVTMTGTVDTATAGTYTVTYTATDEAGNTGETERRVVVFSNQPTISFSTNAQPTITDSETAETYNLAFTLDVSKVITAITEDISVVSYEMWYEGACTAMTTIPTFETSDSPTIALFALESDDTQSMSYKIQHGASDTPVEAVNCVLVMKIKEALSTDWLPLNKLAVPFSCNESGCAVGGFDTTAPILSNPGSIGSTSNQTPSFTFTSDEAGTITYIGNCSSADTEAASGENTVTFNALAEGTYSSCALTVTDNADNTSNELSVPEFTIDTIAPIITLNGNSVITLNVGDHYTEKGAITDTGESVHITGTVDTATVGTYTIVYTATDAAGNNGRTVRVVIVSPAPIEDDNQEDDNQGGGVIQQGIDTSDQGNSNEEDEEESNNDQGSRNYRYSRTGRRGTYGVLHRFTGRAPVFTVTDSEENTQNQGGGAVSDSFLLKVIAIAQAVSDLLTELEHVNTDEVTRSQIFTEIESIVAQLISLIQEAISYEEDPNMALA